MWNCLFLMKTSEFLRAPFIYFSSWYNTLWIKSMNSTSDVKIDFQIFWVDQDISLRSLSTEKSLDQERGFTSEKYFVQEHFPKKNCCHLYFFHSKVGRYYTYIKYTNPHSYYFLTDMNYRYNCISVTKFNNSLVECEINLKSWGSKITANTRKE